MDLLWRGRGKDIADGNARGEALPDVAEEEGEVAGAAARDDADLAARARICANDRTAVGVGCPELVAVGEQDAVDDLIDEVLG